MPSGLLLVGGALSAVGAMFPTAHAFDRSALGSVHVAVWIVLLPAVIALLLAQRRPLLGVGLCAGAGVAAIGRMLADLGVLTDPNSAVRPELFYELTTRAQPFTGAAGAGVMVAGDLVSVIGGVWAARAMADRLTPAAAPIFDRPAAEASAEPAQGPELLVQVWEVETVRRATDIDPRTVAPPTADADPAGRNNGLIVAGFVGVLVLLAGSLGLPYSGGYLATRYLPAELGLAGVGSALAVALVATIAVLVAAALPRGLAAALLGGVALSAALPWLTAVVVRLAGAPVELTAAVPIGFGGAVVVAAAGLLGNAAPLVDDDEVPSSSVLRRTRWLGAALSLLTAGAALAGWRLPQLRYNGGADPVLAGGYAISAPLAAPFLLAAVLPLTAAVLWLVPASGAAGRAVATIGWLPLVFAATQTLHLFGQLVSSASVPNAGFAAPRWTAGAGLWCAVAGIVLGTGAAVIAARAQRQYSDASTLVAQEESLARCRTLAGPVATALSVLTVVAMALPVYRTTAGSSATLLVGFDVRSWGVLALGAGMVTAAVAGGRALRPLSTIGFLLAGAAISVVRLVLPASVRAADGFSVGAGWYVGSATAALFVVAAALLAIWTRRIVLVDAGASDGDGPPRVGGRRPARATDRRSSPPARGSAGKRPVGKRSSAGASSSNVKGRAS